MRKGALNIVNVGSAVTDISLFALHFFSSPRKHAWSNVLQSNFVLKLAASPYLIIGYGHTWEVSAGFEKAHDDPSDVFAPCACDTFKAECRGVNIKTIRKRLHKETVRTTIAEDLGGGGTTRLVPRSLTADYRKKHWLSLIEIFLKCQPTIRNSLITFSLASWCFTYDPERQNALWMSPEYITREKTMLLKIKDDVGRIFRR